MTTPDTRRIYVRQSFVTSLDLDGDFYGDNVDTLDEFVRRAQNDSAFYELLDNSDPNKETT